MVLTKKEIRGRNVRLLKKPKDKSKRSYNLFWLDLLVSSASHYIFSVFTVHFDF